MQNGGGGRVRRLKANAGIQWTEVRPFQKIFEEKERKKGKKGGRSNEHLPGVTAKSPSRPGGELMETG